MKRWVLLAAIVVSVFSTTILLAAPQLGLPGQLNYSPMTVDEIQALEWMRDNYESPDRNLTLWNFLICDYICKEYAAIVFFDLEIHQKSNGTTVATSEEFWTEHFLIYYMTILGEDVSDEAFKFALYSDRQAEKAVFRLWSVEGRRRQYQAFPMMDIWENNPDWQNVYDYKGVIVYERVSS